MTSNMPDRKLTDEEIDRAFVAVLAINARQTDIAVVQHLGGTVDVLAEYIHDHWMGDSSDDPETFQEIHRAIDQSLEREDADS